MVRVWSMELFWMKRGPNGPIAALSPGRLGEQNAQSIGIRSATTEIVGYLYPIDQPGGKRGVPWGTRYLRGGPDGVATAA